MSQSNNGEIKLKIEQRLKEIDDELDNYEKSLGLPTYKLLSANIAEYTEMSREKLERLTPEQAGEISSLLSSYVFFLQRSLNRESAKIRWCESNIDDIIADEVDNYSGYSFVERKNKALKNNSLANEIKSTKVRCEGRSDRLQFLATSLKNFADHLTNLQRAKYGSR